MQMYSSVFLACVATGSSACASTTLSNPPSRLHTGSFRMDEPLQLARHRSKHYMVTGCPFETVFWFKLQLLQRPSFAVVSCACAESRSCQLPFNLRSQSIPTFLTLMTTSETCAAFQPGGATQIQSRLFSQPARGTQKLPKYEVPARTISSTKKSAIYPPSRFKLPSDRTADILPCLRRHENFRRSGEFYRGWALSVDLHPLSLLS